ncbi:MAG TPA: type III pantothenate kinase [Anaerolineae bacterium]|nr:type III pantothenate kinase [Anaerolineae bacterium]
MLLVIDLGNTNLTLGLYQGRNLGPHWRLATEHARMADEYGIQMLTLLQISGIQLTALDGICLSSVVPPLTVHIKEACIQYLHKDVLIISTALKTNITILYDDPKEVGADRIADAVAVQKKFGGPACIIDFGTATTFNALTEKGEYLGGAIMPGIGIAADALVQRTAKLLPVELKAPPSVIGRNTVHSMQAGLIFGYVSLVEGMVHRYREELGENMKVIGTGGLVHTITQYTESIKIVEPWLTLEGLRILWELNQ